MSEQLDPREAMRRRVESGLERQLSWVPVWFGDRISESMLRWVEAELPLLIAIGALGEEEASAWRARFARAEQAWRAPEAEIFSDELKSRAAALLEKRFEAFARSQPGSGVELGELQAALSLLRAVRLTSKEEHDRWNERIMDAIAERRPPPAPPERPYRAAELERVVSCPSERSGGIRLTCLELYRDCAILRWHRVLSPEQAGAAASAQREARGDWDLREVRRRFTATFELRDDLGTHYRAAAAPSAETGGWRGINGKTGYPLWGASPFVPAVPDNARRLEVRTEADQFTVELG